MKYDAPAFSSVSDFQNDFTIKHSTGFQCNFVHEQTTLSPASCSRKIYDLLLSYLYNFGFSKKIAYCILHDEYWAVNLDSLGLDTLSNTETSKPCIISQRDLVVHKFNILLS